MKNENKEEAKFLSIPYLYCSYIKYLHFIEINELEYEVNN